MSSETRDKVTARTVRNKMAALPRIYGRYCLRFESAIYAFARRNLPNYTGGDWDFRRTSNGGLYMLPITREALLDFTGLANGYSGKMSPDAAGLVISMTVCSHLSFDAVNSGNVPLAQTLSEQYHKLRAYQLDHAEVLEMAKALD